MDQGPEGPGCLLSFDVFPTELQRAGSKSRAADWPKITSVQVTSEPGKPQASETWTPVSWLWGKPPFPVRLKCCGFVVESLGS